MSTRSLIGKLNPDNTVDFIYCHSDGYPDGVGRILNKHYTNPLEVDELLALGDLSSLADTTQWSVFYGRDRNETNVQAERNVPLEAFLGMNFRDEDYKYLLGTDFKWRCFEYDGTPVRLEIENVN